MVLSIIYALGSIQALLLAFFLYQSRHRLWWGNVFISLLLFAIACILTLFLTRLHLGNAIPGFIFWPIVALPALFGPFLFAYLKSFHTAKHLLRCEFRYHLIPFVGLVLLFLPELLTPLSQGMSHLDSPTVKQKIILASYVKSLLVMGYLVACLRLIFGDHLTPQLSLPSLKFLRYLLSLFLAVSILGSVLSTLHWTEQYVSLWADYVELTFLTLLSYMLGTYILITHLSPLHPKARYSKTNLPDSTRAILANELKRLMGEDKLFTSEQYSAKLVCAKLGITEQNLSELLALEFDQNFYDFSHHYRINYFATLLHQQPAASLLDLAEQAGFRSKSSFNRAIKSITGMTPSQFKVQQLQK